MKRSAIPRQAKRVFKGVIFDVYQWPQKMFDGTTKTFEKVRRQNTVVVIASIGKKLVVLKQQQPGSTWYYDLPSGRMDKAGEQPRAAAARELLEETGLAARSLKLWRTYSPSGKVVQNVYFYIATDCRKARGQQLDSGERITVSTVGFDQFLKLSDHPKAFFGPLMIDLLLARIHPENYRYLKNAFFGKTVKRLPPIGPTTNW